MASFNSTDGNNATGVFSAIVLTAPTEKIASVYRIQFEHLKSTVRFLENVDVFCVSDPEGYRIGSGGATLNAMDYLALKIGADRLATGRSFIIHSGGDSRRAPLYSLCGKAWSTVNTTIDGSSEMASPLLLLIAEAFNFCRNLPMGSLVVASSDVMLHIAVSSTGPHQFPTDCVSVVCVPAPTKVAKNHGVFIGDIPEECGDYFIGSTTRYLQKPAESEMHLMGAVFTRAGRDPFALIDSGVVIFSGLALTQLVQLLQHPAVGGVCTATAIHSAQAGGDSSSSSSSAGSSMKREVLRFELYSELLLALKVQNSQHTLADYHIRLNIASSDGVADNASLYAQALPVIYDSLHDIPLNLIFVSEGCFEHLGTTAEVMELLSACDDISNASAATAAKRITSATKHQLFAKKYNLRRSVLSSSVLYTDGNDKRAADCDCILMNSSIVVTANAEHSINTCSSDSGSGGVVHSVVEHSLVCSPTAALINSDTVSGGDGRCMLSHLSGLLTSRLNLNTVSTDATADACAGADISSLMMQQVYLRHEMRDQSSVNRSDNFGSSFVLLLLGIHDNIKGLATLCGQPWNHFLQVSGCSHSDLFPAGLPSDQCTLWDAKLFPVCTLGDLDGTQGVWIVSSDEQSQFQLDGNARILTWFHNIGDKSDTAAGGAANGVAAIAEWKRAKRLSLSDILSRGDASQMLHWRVFCAALHECDAAYYHKPDREVVSVRLAADQRLLEVSTVFEAVCQCIRRLNSIFSDACVVIGEQVCLLLWCVGLMSDALQTTHLSLAISLLLQQLQQTASETQQNQCIEAFSALRCIISTLTSQSEVSLVLAHYLKKLVVSDESLLRVCGVLLSAELLSLFPTESQPRVCFVAAWLVKNRPAEKISEVPVMPELSPVGSEAADVASGGVNYINRVWSQLRSAMTSQLPSVTVVATSAVFGASESVKVSKLLEAAGQRVVLHHIQFSLSSWQDKQQTAPQPQTSTTAAAAAAAATSVGVVCVAAAPVRIDLAGGWSDTPPICYELGGKVLNVSVLVDGQRPVKCVTRLIKRPVIILHSFRWNQKDLGSSSTSSSGGAGDEWEEQLKDCCVVCDSVDNFTGLSNDEPCSLLKASLIVLGVVDPTAAAASESLAARLLRLYGGGLEVACVSRLPAGSGMGGSSILAAAVLRSLKDAITAVTSTAATATATAAATAATAVVDDSASLLYLVSQVEQVLTTGGGWQDQMGAISGGFKLGRSPATLPLTVTVEHLTPPREFIEEFERRVCLVYTGQQRLAKNTLINALRRCALSPRGTGGGSNATMKGDTVSQLIRGAERGAQLLGDGFAASSGLRMDTLLDQLAEVVSEYWELKKEMASGSEPEYIRTILNDHLRPLCAGLSLCGAGAGGFGVLFLKQHASLEDLRRVVALFNNDNKSQQVQLSLHSVQLDLTGITSSVVKEEENAPATSMPIEHYLK